MFAYLYVLFLQIIMSDDIEPESIIQQCGESINKIVLYLSSMANVSQDLTDQGRILVSRTSEAMFNWSNGKNINQSKEDPPGTIWWDGPLGNFIFNVLRLCRNSEYEQLNIKLKDWDYDFVDQIRKLGKSEAMLERPMGPSKVVQSNFEEVIPKARPSMEDIVCPGCDKSYSAEKAYNRHLRKFHPEDLKEFMLPKVLNPKTGRLCSEREANACRDVITCKICNTSEIVLERYNDHYKSRHDNNFTPFGRKVLVSLIFTYLANFVWFQLIGFTSYSDGTCEAVFTSAKKKRQRDSNAKSEINPSTHDSDEVDDVTDDQRSQPKVSTASSEASNESSDEENNDIPSKYQRIDDEDNSNDSSNFHEILTKELNEGAQAPHESSLVVGEKSNTQDTSFTEITVHNQEGAQAPTKTTSIFSIQLSPDPIVDRKKISKSRKGKNTNDITNIMGLLEEDDEVMSGSVGKASDDLESNNNRDDDTDFEDGDSKSFTDLRRKRKYQRQSERNVNRTDESPKLYTVPGNAQFVNWFDDDLRKDKRKGENFHRYTLLLFVKEGNWLDYMTDMLGVDFKLIRLVDWRSKNVVMPTFPTAWFESVPDEPQWGTRK